MWSPSSAPVSSPVSIRQPARVGTPSAHRSASGSRATARSAPTRSAVSSRASVTPGSSGFGKATVGNAASGAACAETTCTSVKPARARASTAVSPPTPCSGVSAIRRVRACRAAGGDAVEVGLADVDDPRRGPTGTETAGVPRRSRPRSRCPRAGELAPVVDVDPCSRCRRAGCARRDLDTGDGPDPTDREREHGVGRAGQSPTANLAPGEHLGSGPGERLRSATGVPGRRPAPCPAPRSAASARGRRSSGGPRRRSCRSPARTGPRSPAVPNRSVPAMRSSAIGGRVPVTGERRASTRCSSTRVRVGVVGDPRIAASRCAGLTTAPPLQWSRAGQQVPQQRPSARPRGAGASTS
jgi:hypothetical protein